MCQLGDAHFLHAVLALETQRQNDGQQFQKIDVARRLQQHAVEDGEELLAAEHFVVEGDEQRAGAPLALAAPGRAEHHLVQERAQAVARRDEVLGADAAFARCRLEGLHLRCDAPAQTARIGMRGRIAQLRANGQQRSGRVHQRVHSGAQVGRLHRLSGGRRWRRGGRRLSCRGRSRSAGAPTSAGRRLELRAIAVAAEGIVGAHRPASSLVSLG